MNIPRSISQPRKTRPFVSEIICEYWTTLLNLESSHIPHTNFYNDIIFNDATEGQKTNKNWTQGTHTAQFTRPQPCRKLGAQNGQDTRTP